MTSLFFSICFPLKNQRSDVEQRADNVEEPADPESVENPQETDERFQDVFLLESIDETRDTVNAIEEDCKKNAYDPRKVHDCICKRALFCHNFAIMMISLI